MQVNNETFLIGTDTEFFLQDKKTKEIISAEGIALGSKHSPFNFDNRNPYYAVSLDNVLYETCIPPANNVKEFVENLLYAKQWIEQHIPDGLCVASLPSARLDERFLLSDHAKTFGCDPDFNAWRNGEQNPLPVSNISTLRSAGFHVHVGYEFPNKYRSMDIIQWMDVMLGVPSLLIEPDNERRELYGKAGAFREKPYGVEYRVLSSFFSEDAEKIAWVYNNTEEAIKMSMNSSIYDFSNLYTDVPKAINTNDKTLAEKIVRELNIPILKVA